MVGHFLWVATILFYVVQAGFGFSFLSRETNSQKIQHRFLIAAFQLTSPQLFKSPSSCPVSSHAVLNLAVVVSIKASAIGYRLPSHVLIDPFIRTNLVITWLIWFPFVEMVFNPISSWKSIRAINKLHRAQWKAHNIDQLQRLPFCCRLLNAILIWFTTCVCLLFAP